MTSLGTARLRTTRGRADSTLASRPPPPLRRVNYFERPSVSTCVTACFSCVHWLSRYYSSLAPLPSCSTRFSPQPFRSSQAVAHITLSIDIHELQIYAGSENALGLVVSPAVYNATEARIRIWSSTKDARAACWHAAFFLRSSLQHYQQSASDLAGCLHHRWAVFIATLTLYCFGRASESTRLSWLNSTHTDVLQGWEGLCQFALFALLTHAVPSSQRAALQVHRRPTIRKQRWTTLTLYASSIASFIPLDSN